MRIKVIQFKEFETYLEQTEKIDLKSNLSLFTGELDEYPRKGKLLNLEASINEKSAYIKGSIHKAYNMLNSKGKQNYDDFNYDCAKDTVKYIREELELENNTSLTNLELGINIHLSKDPQHFIDYNLLMYDYKSHNKDLKFAGRGDYKEYQKTDYYIKIYNKSKQFNLEGNILRVELKILTKRMLHKLRVFSLEDLLKPEVITNIYNMLAGELKKLNIIDDYETKNIAPEDRLLFNTYTNPNFWKRVGRDKSYRQRDELREDFQQLIDKYKLNTLKKEVLTKVEEKFKELMSNPCGGYKEVA